MNGKHALGSVLKWVGLIWIYGAIAFILFGYAMIVFMAPTLWEGFKKLGEILSPFNVWNYFSVILTLAPGIGVYVLSKKLQKREKPEMVKGVK